MKLVIFGASGDLGRALVSQACEAGHQVTAFLRDPAQLAPQEGLAQVIGDATDPEAVARAVQGQDVVIITLGARPEPLDWVPGLRRTPPPRICETGTRNILAALPDSAPTRLIVVSAYGVGETRDLAPWYYRLYLRLFLAATIADKEQQEALLKARALEHTIVQPVALTNGPATGTWRASTDGTLGKQQVARADLARFILTETLEGQYPRQTVSFSG